MKSKPVIPRELANQDVNEAVEYYLSTGAEQAALGFIEALEQAYAHIGRHRNAIAAGHPHFHLGGHGQQKTEAPCAPGQSSRRMKYWFPPRRSGKSRSKLV